MSEHTIAVDSREQEPYEFANLSTTRCKLDSGDYSIVGYENEIAVERKSLDDFVQSVIKKANRKRFYAELERLSLFPFRCVVVEGSIRDVYNHNYMSGAKPETVFGFAIQIEIDMDIAVHFCQDRPSAKLMTEKYLLKAANLLDKEGK